MKSKVELEATLNIAPELGDVVCVKIEANYYPGSPAVFYMSNGDPGHPEEPDEVEVLKVVRTDTGEELEWDSLPEACQKAAEDAVREHIADTDDDGPEPPDPTLEDEVCRAEYLADTTGDR